MQIQLYELYFWYGHMVIFQLSMIAIQSCTLISSSAVESAIIHFFLFFFSFLKPKFKGVITCCSSRCSCGLIRPFLDNDGEDKP